MITDERLKEIISRYQSSKEHGRYIGSFDDNEESNDIQSALTELLSLRSQKKALIEDANRLAKIISGTLKAVDFTGSIDGFFGMSISRGGYEDQQLAVFMHKELLKELK